MKNLEASFRALRVLHTAKDLFNQFGFHKVGGRIELLSAIPKFPKPLLTTSTL